MKNMKKTIALLVSLVMIFALAACGSNNNSTSESPAAAASSSPASSSSADPSEAKKLSGKLVIYTGSGPEITDPLFKGFNTLYPDIKIEMVKGGSGELIARMSAEKSNPGGDILMGGDPYTYDVNKALFQPYEAATDKDMIAQDPNHIWHVWTLMPQAILINTKLLKDESQWPKSIKDLADPKYKSVGKIALADPGKSGTGSAIVNGIISLYDWDFMQDMLKNVEVSSGSDAMFDAVKDGAVPIGFINEDLGAKWEQMNLPIKMIYPEDGVTNVLDAMGVIAGAKNADNAKAFIEYMGSKDAHEILRNDVLRRSTRTDVAPPEGIADLSTMNMVESKLISRDDIASNFNDRLEKARK